MREELVIPNKNVDFCESYNDDDGTSNNLLVRFLRKISKRRNYIL